MVKDCDGPNWACYGQPVGKELVTFETCPLVARARNNEFNLLQQILCKSSCKTDHVATLVYICLFFENNAFGLNSDRN